MKVNKIFCDICKKEIFMDRNNQNPIESEYVKLSCYSSFDVCKKCFKEFKKWRRAQLKNQKLPMR